MHNRTYVWYNLIPILTTIRDEGRENERQPAGEIRTVHQIRVLSQEEKMFAGIAFLEFDCIITILEQQIAVQLIYYKEENKWMLVYR